MAEAEKRAPLQQVCLRKKKRKEKEVGSFSGDTLILAPTFSDRVHCNGQMNESSERSKSICSINFFQVWGIKTEKLTEVDTLIHFSIGFR